MCVDAGIFYLSKKKDDCLVHMVLILLPSKWMCRNEFAWSGISINRLIYSSGFTVFACMAQLIGDAKVKRLKVWNDDNILCFLMHNWCRCHIIKSWNGPTSKNYRIEMDLLSPIGWIGFLCGSILNCPLSWFYRCLLRRLSEWCVCVCFLWHL